MNIEGVLNSSWFWALWSVMGGYAIMKIKKKGLPLFGDFVTFWFGITALLIGFISDISLWGLFFSNVQKHNTINIYTIAYLVFFIASFIVTARFLMQQKYLKPFAFIIEMFIMGVILHNLYVLAW